MPYQPVPPRAVGKASVTARVRRSALGRLTVMFAALFFSGATALAVLLVSGLHLDVDLNDLQLGERAFAPTTIADLPNNTRLDAGSIRIDLSEMTFEPNAAAGTEPHRLDLSVTAGEIVIVLPEDQPIQVNPTVEKGSLSVSPGATSVTSPALVLDATVRYGDVVVTYAD